MSVVIWEYQHLGYMLWEIKKMTAFTAILKITFKAAIRSNMFRVLLSILLLTIFLLPISIVGDGTAESFIKISLNYCLSTVAFILALSTIWLACHIMASDIESYRIHMLVTKPVSRMNIWLAKWTGVVLINSILLIISAVTVYIMVSWHYSSIDFDKNEKEKINTQILVGRRVFMPVHPDLNSTVNSLFKRRIKELAKQNKILPEGDKMALRDNIRNYIKASEGEVRNGMTKIWRYKNLSSLKNKKLPFFVRFRLYPDHYEIKKQLQTYGIWGVKVVKPERITGKKQSEQKGMALFATKTDYAETIPCAVFQETSFFNTDAIDENGNIMIGFVNMDPTGANLHFQLPDGPKLMLRITGFSENYARAIFLIFLEIALLAAIACTFAATLSMPVSMIFVFAYLFMGACSQYLLNYYNSLDPAVAAIKGNLNFYDLLGRSLSSVLMLFIVPINDFNATNLLASGQLIEISFIIDKLFFGFFLKGITIMAIGIYFYSKRELGLVVKK